MTRILTRLITGAALLCAASQAYAAPAAHHRAAAHAAARPVIIQKSEATPPDSPGVFGPNYDYSNTDHNIGGD